jgi:hypothetical protein
LHSAGSALKRKFNLVNIHNNNLTENENERQRKINHNS